MSFDFVLKVKRAETPFYAAVKRLAQRLIHFDIVVPRPMGLILRTTYETRVATTKLWIRVRAVLYYGPIFRTYCVSAGRNLYLELIPSVSGPVRIHIGNDVCISGALGIASGHVVDEPELYIGDRVFLGHQVALRVNRQVIIQDGVLVAQGCYIADSDEHPLDADLRMQGSSPRIHDIKSVHIGRNAWLGRGATVLKGVCIGEGAVIGAGAVVMSDIPPFSVAVGNPARVVMALRKQ